MEIIENCITHETFRLSWRSGTKSDYEDNDCGYDPTLGNKLFYFPSDNKTKSDVELQHSTHNITKIEAWGTKYLNTTFSLPSIFS